MFELMVFKARGLFAFQEVLQLIIDIVSQATHEQGDRKTDPKSAVVPMRRTDEGKNECRLDRNESFEDPVGSQAPLCDVH
jgi:hypothetical protein